jgi:hypothetical protein
VNVHLLGIRHHGPGSARCVLQALDAIDADVVLIELPADLGPALGWIGSDGLVPPVALLGYAVAEPRRAVFAPLGAFSPEWQAAAWANRHGVEVRAIDLPLSMTLADSSEPELVGASAPPDPIGELAAAAGETDAERWWEDVVEHRGDGAVAFDAVADAMRAVREGVIATRRELQREAHMRRAIRAAQHDGHRSIAVVCGAWHVPALEPSSHTVAADAALLRGLPKTKVASAWVPWTHRRLASWSGYGAGVESPGWYHHVFEHPGADGVAAFFVDVARVQRRAGWNASPDDLIAGTRLADALAVMRGRPRAGLAEILDAADAVMGNIDLIRRELVVGEAIGTVPVGAPQVPLARDLARAQKSARLTPNADAVTIELDVRTPNGHRRSLLLHRLLALGVAWGVPEEGRGTSGTFRETWRLRWEPELSIRLVEQSGYGSTLEGAATAHLVERAEQAGGVLAVLDVLDRALLAQLPDVIPPALDALGVHAAADRDVGHLMDAALPLANAIRYGDVRGTHSDSLRSLFDQLVERILAGVVAACVSLDDESAGLAVERLSAVQAALGMLDHPARAGAFPAALARIADGGGHGLVQGRATRLLHDSGVWGAATVERRLSRALSGGIPAARGAAFVEGFLAGSGTVLVHDVELLAIVDTWLAALPSAAFDDVVALLRRTFGGFEPAERRQIMTLLITGRSTQERTFGDDVDARRAEMALTTVRQMLGVRVHENDLEVVQR